MKKNKKAKLLYIVSVGHSGSTLLDLLCGSLNNVFSMGEMHFLSWQLLQGPTPEDPQTYCSCGKGFSECVFWSKVLERINEENQVNVFDKPRDYDFSLNRDIERYKKNLPKKILCKLLQLGLKYKLMMPFAYLSYICFLPSVKRNWDLFDKVADESNSEYLVDSSKNPLRFWLLRKYRPQDIKLIILIRDLKGVASSSHNGLNQKIIDQRAKSWLRFYQEKIPKITIDMEKTACLSIKYEEICQSPNLIRSKIAGFLHEDCHDSIDYISPYKYHTVQGNPMRLQKNDVTIRYDERWKKRLTEKQISDLELIASKLQL